MGQREVGGVTQGAVHTVLGVGCKRDMVGGWLRKHYSHLLGGSEQVFTN